ncbi:MAG: hypothetical protein CMG11_00380 [Candidatus Marinimicrobia bacterium]|nr:hypothetical protein [Candidatus Neomarinimicrobiota bacterium]
MHIILILLSFSFAVNLNQWNNISSDLSPNHLVEIEGNLYGSGKGGFFIYNLETNNFTLNNHNQCLEVASISSDDNNDLWILCQNGTLYKQNSNLIINHLNIDRAIDFIIHEESIYVIYENDNVYGIADFSFNNNSLVYNDYYESFTENIYEEFKSIIVLNNYIYLLTDNGFYYADIDSNLKFPNNWNNVDDINIPIDICSFNEKLIFMNTDFLQVFDVSTNQVFTETESIDFELGGFITQSINSNVLSIVGNEKIITFNSSFDIIGEYQGDFSNTISIYPESNKIYLGVVNQGFWIIDKYIQKCAPNCPMSYDIEALYFNNKKLYGVSRDGVFVYDQDEFFNLLSNRSQNNYLMSDYINDCNMFNGHQLSYIPGSKISSSIISYNNEIFIPNSGIIPSEIEDRGGLITINEDDFTIDNIIGESQLEGLNGIYDSNTNNYLTINQIKKDNLNRIWVVNPYAEQSGHILSILSPEDKSWSSIQAPDNQSYLPQEIAFDSNGLGWVAFRYETKLINSDVYSSGGLKIVMPNGNWFLVENLEALPGDDENVSVWSINFSNFQGNEILWVLTSSGVQGYSISPSLNGDFFNDDLSDDYLFRIDEIYPLDFFTNISFSKGDKIKIDPQNNIWIITAHSGIYVIKNNIEFWPNSDGINVENSDILSNVVRDVAFDTENGIAYIATNKGLSVLGIPFEENQNNRNVGISPNPFVIGTNNEILIEDMYSGSLIKVMTLSGKVVKEIQLPYNENKINWDGIDKKGRVVDTGVYLVVVENEKYGNGLTKLAIIK